MGGMDVRPDHDVKRIIGVQLQSSSFFDKLKLDELLTLFGKCTDGPSIPPCSSTRWSCRRNRSRVGDFRGDKSSDFRSPPRS